MACVFTFFEGLLAFASPCVLPMLPIYIAYLAGDEPYINVKKRLINTVFFVSGFTLSFVAMGTTAFAFGRFLSSYKNIAIKLAGAIIVFFGLVYLGFINIRLPSYKSEFRKSSYFSNFLFGLGYAFGWSPCTGAFLGAALSLSAVQDAVLSGICLLLCFSLGLGIPFIIFSIFFEKLKFGFFQKLKSKIGVFKIAGGVFMIFMGFSMIFNFYDYYLRFFDLLKK